MVTTTTSASSAATPVPSLSNSLSASPEISRLPTPSDKFQARPLSPSPAPSDTANSPTPRAGSPLSMPKTDQYDPRGSLPNTLFAVTMIATILGGVLTASLVLVLRPYLEILAGRWATPRLGIYIAAFSLFHLLEFFTTAGWNPLKVSVDAYLLNNTKQYHMAHAFGLLEYFVTAYFFPGRLDSPWCSGTALAFITAVMIGSQVIRSLAMIQAAQSFSHVVKSRKHDDHVLVTYGLYSWSRHPAYTGFFYWAVATQLLLGNVISTLGFVVVLSRFFSARIVDEERWLVKFFGDDYVEYRKRVGTKLPFFYSPQ
ncbi:hypothetical protein IAU60_000841 [Kwoniella sp. DSM 27419]